jgi:lipoate-protein ligase A
MKYIETGSCSPAINLAYEEYFLKGKDLEEDVFMLWRNEPAVVVGRFQNTLTEINSSFAEAHRIQVRRRISGGGAVYHDLGNLCFSFILQDIQPEVLDKSKYVRPLITALNKMGVQAEVTNRNDLTIAGKKFSGNAMALCKNRLLFHGTLLFDTDLAILNEVLKSSGVIIESKGVKSVRSSVINLKECFPGEMNILQFKQNMKQILWADTPGETYIPSQEDLDAIQELVKTKYEAWEWNFGRDPNSRIERCCQFPDGLVQIHLELEKGVIKNCQIKSSSKKVTNTTEIEEQLENVRYAPTDIKLALSGLDIVQKLGFASNDDFVQSILC